MFYFFIKMLFHTALANEKALVPNEIHKQNNIQGQPLRFWTSNPVCPSNEGAPRARTVRIFSGTVSGANSLSADDPDPFYVVSNENHHPTNVIPYPNIYHRSEKG